MSDLKKLKLNLQDLNSLLKAVNEISGATASMDDSAMKAEVGTKIKKPYGNGGTPATVSVPSSRPAPKPVSTPRPAELIKYGKNGQWSLDKAANLDEKADAELGEKVEEVVEQHMLDNKEEEKKEGHKILAGK